MDNGGQHWASTRAWMHKGCARMQSHAPPHQCSGQGQAMGSCTAGMHCDCLTTSQQSFTAGTVTGLCIWACRVYNVDRTHVVCGLLYQSPFSAPVISVQYNCPYRCRALLHVCSYSHLALIQWPSAQVFDDMQARGVLTDVVTCCSLINALERGGQWQLAEQLFVQMCAASWQSQGVNSPLYRIMEIAAAPAPEVTEMTLTQSNSSPHQAVPWGDADATIDRRESDDSVKQHTAPWTPVALPVSDTSPVAKTIELTSRSSQKTDSSPLELRRSSSSLQFNVRSPNDRSDGMPIHSLSRPHKKSPLDQVPSSDLHFTRTDSLLSQDATAVVGKGTSSSVTQAPPFKHSSGSLQTASSSNSAVDSPSDYSPRYVEKRRNPPLESSASGLTSPAQPSFAVYSQALNGQSSADSTELLNSFSNMSVGNSAPSVQRALFPQEQPRKLSGLSTSRSNSEECSDSTVRRIQEAAMN